MKIVCRKLAAVAAIAILPAALMTQTTSPAGAVVGDQHVHVDRMLHALHNFLGRRVGTATVGVLDLNSGQRVLYRPTHQQLTASVVKVEILMALLARRHAPLPAARKTEARRMITQSSNADAQRLWQAIGRVHGAARFGRRVGLQTTAPAGGTGPGYPWGLTLTTPADQLRLLSLLAEHNHVLSDRDRTYEWSLMRHVEAGQRWGIRAGTSATSSVALKDGWLPLRGNRDWQVNSIGYVRAPHHKYLISVMSAGSPTMSYGIHTVEGVSRIVWRNTGWPVE